jgi:hypothetical protein
VPELIGQQFGNYRLLRLLGEGGFAEVYLGQHLLLSTQQGAIKILSIRLNKEVILAFKQEAVTIASLVHHHIVRVLDFDVTEGIPFLVMDYAPNGSLRQHHRPGEQVPLSSVISYVQQVAHGLQYAHDARIIHRDIKPHNMLIGRRGEILLSDFGIATIAHHTSSMRSIAYAGTPAYMAPEQFQNRPVPASDQYALAVVVYEWLCGQLPYQGDPYAVGMQHLTAPIPSLRIHNNTLSPAIEAVVQQAMAKDPNERFGSVQAFATALKEASAVPSSAQATIYPAAQPIQTPILPTTPVPLNKTETTAAFCEVDNCGIHAIGRCTTCKRAFCGSHQAWSGQNYYIDLCAPCFAIKMAEEVRLKEEADAPYEYFRSGAARTALLTSGMQPVKIYIITKRWKDSFFGRKGGGKEVEDATLIGNGWILGEIKWESEHSTSDGRPHVTRQEFMNYLTALLVVSPDKEWNYGYNRILTCVKTYLDGYEVAISGSNILEIPKHYKGWREAMQAVKRLAGVSS